MKSILLKCLSVLKMFGDYLKYSDRLIYTVEVLSISMKDQIPYLTNIHELRSKFRCVHTGDPQKCQEVVSREVRPQNVVFGKTLQKTLLCLFFVYGGVCVCFGNGFVFFWFCFLALFVRLGKIGALDWKMQYCLYLAKCSGTDGLQVQVTVSCGIICWRT